VKAEELQTLDAEGLSSRLKGARRELYELRFKLAVGQLDDHRQIRKVRKDIARILTVVHARRLGGTAEDARVRVAAVGETEAPPVRPVTTATAEPLSEETPEDVEAENQVESPVSRGESGPKEGND
jgi:large subunit ribosomal protein L29